MAHSVIFRRLLEIISNRHAGNATRPAKPPFPDVQAHFHRYKAPSNCLTSRNASLTCRAQTQTTRLPVVFHPVEPTLTLWGARCVDGPQRSRERPYPGEAKDVPFEPADAICLDVRLQIGAGIMPTSKPALT